MPMYLAPSFSPTSVRLPQTSTLAPATIQRPSSSAIITQPSSYRGITRNFDDWPAPSATVSLFDSVAHDPHLDRDNQTYARSPRFKTVTFTPKRQPIPSFSSPNKQYHQDRTKELQAHVASTLSMSARRSPALRRSNSVLGQIKHETNRRAPNIVSGYSGSNIDGGGHVVATQPMPGPKSAGPTRPSLTTAEDASRVPTFADARNSTEYGPPRGLARSTILSGRTELPPRSASGARSLVSTLGLKEIWTSPSVLSPLPKGNELPRQSSIGDQPCTHSSYDRYASKSSTTILSPSYSTQAVLGDLGTNPGWQPDSLGDLQAEGRSTTQLSSISPSIQRSFSPSPQPQNRLSHAYHPLTQSQNVGLSHRPRSKPVPAILEDDSEDEINHRSQQVAQHQSSPVSKPRHGTHHSNLTQNLRTQYSAPRGRRSYLKENSSTVMSDLRLTPAKELHGDRNKSTGQGLSGSSTIGPDGMVHRARGHSSVSVLQSRPTLDSISP